MVTESEVKQICLALPEVVDESGERLSFSVRIEGKSSVKYKGIAWSWLERKSPKARREPNLRVLAIRVASLDVKEILLSSNQVAYFTEDHYNGYAAILVRLDEVDRPELQDLLYEAWLSVVPAKMASAMTQSQ